MYTTNQSVYIHQPLSFITYRSRGIHMIDNIQWCEVSEPRTPTLTVTFNVDNHFHLEMIVNINVIIHVINPLRMRSRVTVVCLSVCLSVPALGVLILSCQVQA